MRVLIDTSVWRRHFAGRLSDEHLGWMNTLLDDENVSLPLHPWVLGELLLGGLSAKEEGLLLLLPAAGEISSTETLEFVRAHQLARRGIGWVDSQLVASTRAHEALLWTFDDNLALIAAELSVGFCGLE